MSLAEDRKAQNSTGKFRGVPTSWPEPKRRLLFKVGRAELSRAEVTTMQRVAEAKDFMTGNECIKDRKRGSNS
jgi:hypothetical protein